MGFWSVLYYIVVGTCIAVGAFFLIAVGLIGMGLKNKYAPVKKSPDSNETMVERIFQWEVIQLLKLASMFKLSYHEINIILYFFVVPFSWFVMLDALFHLHYLKLSFAFFCIGFFTGCSDFKPFATSLYRKSVYFLLYFNRFGSNYIASSVLICLVIPICIYALLIYLLIQ
jgi:hypothetical protein